MGYLISAEIPKAKQCKQIVCLSCVDKLLGKVTENIDGLSITLSIRKDGGQDTAVLRRETLRSPWSQTLELTDDVLSFLCRENATTVPGRRPVATAASQVGKRGMAKGMRPRAKGATEESSTEIWVKGKEGRLKLNFRKSDRRIMGYLISAEIPKAKQCKQIVCLSCVDRLLGKVTVSIDGLSITLSIRKDGGQDTAVLRRETLGSPWSQTLELTDDVLSFLCRENATTVPGQRSVATAASQVGKRGMAKGMRPRAKGATEESSTEGAVLGIKAHAVRYLGMMVSPDESVRVFLPTGSASPPLRLYMSAWDHNGEGRPKKLGKPDKMHALPEIVWLDTLGELCCSCDRGRLMEDAPCVHKLAMAAISESWALTAELPTHESLGRGARVERVGADATGSYFAVADNLQGPPGPRRRMLFRRSKGAWYCEGKREGCPSLMDCSHVSAAKAALRLD
ncbi:hypothetical protein KFL_017330010 [Klebsormidium nitens]|uniref:SWIM-type domain-containing protein n=1 Tax=Klebsormidium nitens TaxID=105231 RepID=A0A1Y1IRX4_KLENI|nr:hypothetical protein KFL_017330010 [Klebsormidium nitens]|eukprot:GAQ93630.1 hypothetical protein KFL_017330010 [Klebsormidium nitens]